MRDGKLKLDVVEGKIVSVEVGSGLDIFYEDLFRSAWTELANDDLGVDVGIRLVLFGCFWLEAIANDTLKAVLQEVIEQQEVMLVVWDALERRRFAEKCGAMVRMAQDIDKDWAATTLKQVEKVFALRNRLAHFKPDFAEVRNPVPEGSTDVRELAALFLDTPDSELVSQLRSSEEMDAMAKSVVETEQLLEAILQSFIDRDVKTPSDCAANDNGA